MVLFQFLTFSALILVHVFAGKGPFDLSQDPRYSPAPVEEGLIEGDFKLTDQQKVNLKLFKNVYGPKSRAASGRERERWPGAVIPYVFDCSVTNMASVIKSVKVAMAEWEKKTCIRFVERTNEENYLEFFRAAGCWASYVGYQNVKTQISIGEGCDYKHVMVHELGHVIGFWHEQSRPDRDHYIQIVWDNVIDAMKYNFDKVVDGAVDSVDEPYDYASIMHYPFNAFSKDYNKDTIIPIRPLNGKTPYVELTNSDAAQANKMYKCLAVVRERREKLTELQKALPATFQSDESSCMDDHETCPVWAADHGCINAPNPLLLVCRKSCANCGPCVDDNVYCKSWADYNHCDKNPSYMWKHCKVSCGICKPGPNTPSPTTQPRPTTQQTTQETKPPTTQPTPTPTEPEPTVKPTLPKYRGIKCADADERCPEYAANGGCKLNEWTKRNCQLSCQRTDLCDLEQPRPSGSCAEPLGLGWDRTVPDSSFMASTSFFPGGGWGASAANARLYMVDDHQERRIGAWCAQPRYVNHQWLRVDLGQIKMISAVATQGRYRYFEHVETYMLSFSENGSNWQEYKENGTGKIFNGNCDNITPVINKLSKPIRARYVKFHPKLFYAGICMRVEVFGCNI